MDKMADHSELVAEITTIEKMTTTERLKHAKKRRQMQLKKFGQYEKQLDKESGKKSKKAKESKKAALSAARKTTNNNARRVIFVDNIMLLEAAARNDIDEVRSLLQKEVSPDVTNEDGLTALHQCCIDDLADMMKLLISYGANVNARDSELWTPLHAAATCGHVHLCSYLIDSGAELLAVNADGNMPYDICEDEETLDFIENEMAKRGVTQELIDNTRLSTERQMLEDLRADPTRERLEQQGRQGETPLHIASANGYLEVAEFLLLEQHVRVDVPDNDSWQPIHAASCWGHLPVLEVLVQNGADLDARTKNGETPYDICEDPEIRDRILEMKTEIESNKRTRPNRLVRRRSTNTRSAGNFHNSTGSLYSSNQSLQGDRSLSTVRRSSVRGKGAMYLKEAKEEAERLREAVSSNDDDEEEERTVSLVSDVNDIKVTLNGTSEDSSHAQESAVSSSYSHLSSTDTDPPNSSSITDSPNKTSSVNASANSSTPLLPKPSNDKDSIPRPPNRNSQQKKQTDQQQHQLKQQELLRQQQEQQKQKLEREKLKHEQEKLKHEQEKLKQQEQQKQKQEQQKQKQEQQKQQQQMPSPSSPPVAVITNVRNTSTTTTTTAQEPQSHRENNSSSSLNSVDKNSSNRSIPSATTAPPPSTATKMSSSEARKTSTSSQPTNGETREPYQQRQQQPPTQQGGFDPMHPPLSGTLADLKKKRAQELRDSMRFRDPSRLNQQIESHNEGYENAQLSADNSSYHSGGGGGGGGGGVNSPSSGNGQNGAVRRDSDASYYGLEDPPKHKFTASTQEIVGGHDNNTGCCVLM